MLIYKDKLIDKVEEMALQSGLSGLLANRGFIFYVDKQKTGVRVKLDFVDASSTNDHTFASWERLLREEFGDLVIRVQRGKGTFTHDSAGRYLGGREGTTVRVRFKKEVREYVQ